MVQEACFRYYWEAAHPNAGMAIEILPGDKIWWRWDRLDSELWPLSWALSENSSPANKA